MEQFIFHWFRLFYLRHENIHILLARQVHDNPYKPCYNSQSSKIGPYESPLDHPWRYDFQGSIDGHYGRKDKKDSDHLFIEASFLEKDKDIAEKNVARQAGLIAGKAGVKQLTPFHFSPRYQGQAHMLEKEAMDAYHYALKQ
jgi:hypothetical protein